LKVVTKVRSLDEVSIVLSIDEVDALIERKAYSTTADEVVMLSIRAPHRRERG
jgi:hypothetical protein